MKLKDLSGNHIGSIIMLQDESGWVHTGQLQEVNHRHRYDSETINTWVIIRYVDRARWHGTLPGDTEVKFV